MPKALKSYPKSNKPPNLVTLHEIYNIQSEAYISGYCIYDTLKFVNDIGSMVIFHKRLRIRKFRLCFKFLLKLIILFLNFQVDWSFGCSHWSIFRVHIKREFFFTITITILVTVTNVKKKQCCTSECNCKMNRIQSECDFLKCFEGAHPWESTN